MRYTDKYESRTRRNFCEKNSKLSVKGELGEVSDQVEVYRYLMGTKSNA